MDVARSTTSATPQSPEEWLPVLLKRCDARIPRIRRLRAYANGEAQLPEMGDNLRESWEAFQKKARTNFGGLTVATVAGRIKPLGVSAGDGANPELTAALQRIWRDNRASTQIKLAVRDMLITGVGYLLVASNGGRATLVSRPPEDFYAATDPLRPWKARAYVSTWRDTDEKATFAYVAMEGRGQQFRRDDDRSGALYTKLAHGDWKAVGVEDAFDGDPKVAILARPDGVGIFEPNIDVIDRINLGKLHRLVIVAMQAFRQRALKPAPGSGGLPEHDLDGNEINWDKYFSPAPGAVWELPEGIDIWESQPTELQGLLEAEKTDARDFAAVQRLPISVFTPEGANQSAEGAATATDGLYSQAEEEIDNISAAVDAAFVYAARVEGFETDEDTIHVQFAPPDRVSVSERMAAAAQAKGILAIETIQRDILGMSPEDIARDRRARAREQMELAALLPQQDTRTVKDSADALGVLVRAGVDPDNAAQLVGLQGTKFTGAVPVALRMPETQAAQLEEK